MQNTSDNSYKYFGIDIKRFFFNEEYNELRTIFTDEEILKNLNILRKVRLNAAKNTSFLATIKELHLKSKGMDNPKDWIIAQLKSIPDRKINPFFIRIPKKP